MNEVRKSRFPMSLFWTVFGMLLGTAGVHVGLIVLGSKYSWSSIVLVHVILLYWILVSVLIVLYIRKKMHDTYEVPLQEISRATAKVSRGDFSVYIPTTNPAEKYDYLDIMIMDLNKMIEELGSIETLKTDFVSNVSHEMKTPIAVIKNSVQLLRSAENISQEKRREYEDDIDAAATRLSALITNILRLNKLENKFIAPRAERFDLCAQLAECIIQFESRWEEKQIELDVDMEDRRIILHDADMLSLVWNNLLSNAIKFTEPGGKITVREQFMEKSDGAAKNCVCVTVKDSGCGMDEKTANHVFDKFFQGDTSHATEGNGLGLALVSRVLTLIGGTISVKSQVGKGSEFTVTLPLQDTKIEEEKNDA